MHSPNSNIFFSLQNAIKVPYFCRFHVYARRYPSNPGADSAPASPALPKTSGQRISPPNNPAHIIILCLTEPARAVHPLELQEDFVELGRSEYVEVRDNSEIEVHFGGNLYKSHRNHAEECDEFEYDNGSRKLIFHPFSDNRQGFAVKRRNEKNPYGKGSISFLTLGDRTLYEQKLDLSRFM